MKLLYLFIYLICFRYHHFRGKFREPDSRRMGVGCPRMEVTATKVELSKVFRVVQVERFGNEVNEQRTNVRCQSCILSRKRSAFIIEFFSHFETEMESKNCPGRFFDSTLTKAQRKLWDIDYVTRSPIRVINQSNAVRLQWLEIETISGKVRDFQPYVRDGITASQTFFQPSNSVVSKSPPPPEKLFDFLLTVKHSVLEGQENNFEISTVLMKTPSNLSKLHSTGMRSLNVNLFCEVVIFANPLYLKQKI